MEIPEQELYEEFIRPAAGPGGQHVNRTASGVRLHFRFRTSSVLRDSVKTRLESIAGEKLQGDEIVIQAKESRSQERNRVAARARLDALIAAASVEPKIRRKTKPGRAARERRMAEKSRRSQIKKNRSGSWND